jgi:anti-sigma regulatory factor (Ser/Thr protein kinase)
MQETINLRLAGGPRAPARARQALSSLDKALNDVRCDVTLLVSELVTNSVRHGDAHPETTIELIATAAADKVRIEVADNGPGFDVAEAKREREIGGYGLKLVDRIANRWGVISEPSPRVWFEIDHRHN